MYLAVLLENIEKEHPYLVAINNEYGVLRTNSNLYPYPI